MLLDINCLSKNNQYTIFFYFDYLGGFVIHEPYTDLALNRRT